MSFDYRDYRTKHLKQAQQNSLAIPAAVGARGAVKFATSWSHLPVRAAVVLRRGDQLRRKLAVRNRIYARVLVGKELSQKPAGLAATVPDPTMLVLDQLNVLHLVELKEGRVSIKPGNELMSWPAGRVRVTRRSGRFYHEILEIADGEDTLALLVSRKGQARRDALELLEETTESDIARSAEASRGAPSI